VSLQHITRPAQIQALIQEPASQVISPNFCILGDGSNTIFVEDFAGHVIHIAIAGVSVKESVDCYRVEVAAGENWHDFVVWCLKNQLYGLENLALIPGTVGGAAVQNIGAYGLEVERFVENVEYVCLLSGEVKILNHAQCEFGYRDSIFKKALAAKAMISKLVFSLPKRWRPVSHYGELATLATPSPEEIFSQVVKIRQTKLPDPKQIGNAGSFFKNPLIDKDLAEQLASKWPGMPQYPTPQGKVKIPAAWLIDTLGFKGKSVGGIRCHPTQALVLTNTGNGTGAQLLSLAREIKGSVRQEFTITLENEVQLIGAFGPIDL
jgi:UDP-N-acetylmuramate dehydrogenase